MQIIFYIMLFLLVPYVIRILIGPSVWDRLLGLNLIATKIVIIILIYASLHGSSSLLDFATILVLCGFIGTIFTAIFLTKRNLPQKKENNN